MSITEKNIKEMKTVTSGKGSMTLTQTERNAIAFASGYLDSDDEQLAKVSRILMGILRER